jgi:hypothetical protein
MKEVATISKQKRRGKYDAVIAKSGCPSILLAIWWLPLLVQTVGTEDGTPDPMDIRISAFECITAAVWLWPDKCKKQGRVSDISDLNQISRLQITNHANPAKDKPSK